jgi:hypothetical protein
VGPLREGEREKLLDLLLRLSDIENLLGWLLLSNPPGVHRSIYWHLIDARAAIDNAIQIVDDDVLKFPDLTYAQTADVLLRSHRNLIHARADIDNIINNIFQTDDYSVAPFFIENARRVAASLLANDLPTLREHAQARLGSSYGGLESYPPRPGVLGPDELEGIGVPKGLKEEPEVRDRGIELEPDALESLESPRPPAERVVNVGFALPAQADVPIAPTMPLASTALYYFWLEVGDLIEGSIEEAPTPLPVELLPPAARLKVALFAFADELQISSGADIGELQIMPDGAVRVARSAVQPDGIAPGAELLTRRLFFAVRTPGRAGTYRLRCNIYYEQILVQSRVIYARVMRHPHQVERALRSLTDYTLTRSLRPELLARSAPHRLSILLNQNDDGTHSFRFFGEHEFKNDASFDGQELEDLIKQARGAFSLAAWGDEQPWQEGKQYRYSGARNLEQLRADLTRFAIRGYRIYDAIINRLAGGAAGADALATLMNAPGLIQIALKESARYVLPAGLIYDYGLDTSADLASYTLCPAFLAGLDAATALEELGCFKGACPNRGADTIICPSGFWGYRHSLGLPLSVATAADAPPEIVFQQGPQIAVSFSTDKNFVLWPDHQKTLKQLHPNLDWKPADTRDKTFQVLKEAKPHLVYFYCHGGVVNTIPFIQVGALTERGITRDNLRYKKIRWDTPRPLVFINGCHTTALAPEIALELISAFVENAGAAGVIGTEITIFEPLACRFAEECLRRFIAGMPIGQAVRGARLALLKAGNPLGLTYIPFVIAGLRLVEHAGGA